MSEEKEGSDNWVALPKTVRPVFYIPTPDGVGEIPFRKRKNDEDPFFVSDKSGKWIYKPYLDLMNNPEKGLEVEVEDKKYLVKFDTTTKCFEGKPLTPEPVYQKPVLTEIPAEIPASKEVKKEEDLLSIQDLVKADVPINKEEIKSKMREAEKIEKEQQKKVEPQVETPAEVPKELVYKYTCKCGTGRTLTWPSEKEFEKKVGKKGSNVFDIHQKPNGDPCAARIRLTYENDKLVPRTDVPEIADIIIDYVGGKPAVTPKEKLIVGEFHDEIVAYSSRKRTNEKLKSMYKILHEGYKKLLKQTGGDKYIAPITAVDKGLVYRIGGDSSRIFTKLKSKDPELANGILKELAGQKGDIRYAMSPEGNLVDVVIPFKRLQDLHELLHYQKKARKVPFSYGGAEATALVYPYRGRNRVDIIQHSTFNLDALGKLRDMTFTLIDRLEVKNQDVVDLGLFMSPKAADVFDQLMNTKWATVYDTYSMNREAPEFEKMNSRAKWIPRIEAGARLGVGIAAAVSAGWSSSQLIIHPTGLADYQNWQNTERLGGSWTEGLEYTALKAVGQAFLAATLGFWGGVAGLGVDVAEHYIGKVIRKSRYGWDGKPLKDYAHVCSSVKKISKNPLGEGKLLKLVPDKDLPKEGEYSPVPVLKYMYQAGSK